MRYDKTQNKVLILLGFIPTIWLSLLLAPLLDGGIPKILQGFGTLMENPFKITFCEFSIYLATTIDKKRIINDYIATSMEVKNGINEYTLLNKEKYDLNSILKEISNLINEKTKVIYTTSAYKKLIQTDKKYLEGLNNNLKSKIEVGIRRR